MGGEPIKLTELRVLCTERNWQGVLASGATRTNGGLALTLAHSQALLGCEVTSHSSKKGILLGIGKLDLF